MSLAQLKDQAAHLNVREQRELIAFLTAFRVRYGTGLDSIILGEFTGNLSNSGEELQILDPVGEVVLELTYSGQWYAPTDGGGRSLVTRVNNTPHTDFGKPTAWAIGGTANGTPGTADTTFGNEYGGWRWSYFTESELTPLDTTGRIALTGDPKLDGPVKSPHELITRIAASDRARQVWIRHVFRYYLGRNETLADAATLQAADRAYVESDGSYKSLLASLLTSDSFLSRTTDTRTAPLRK